MENKYKRVYLLSLCEVMNALKEGKLVYDLNKSENFYYVMLDGFICLCDAEYDGSIDEINCTLKNEGVYYIIEKI
jgi:hypothetical protein